MKYDLTYLELELRELLKKLKKHNTYAMQLENEIILYKLENDRLKKEIEKQKDYICDLVSEKVKLQEKINKAIEYIDRRDIEWGSEEHKKLLNILKGVDKEWK